MNARLWIALAAFVAWAAITVVGGSMASGGEGSLLEGVSQGIGWAWVAAGGFILAVVLWQGWHDVGLNRLADLAAWRLGWLPMVYIVAAFGFSTVTGLPPAGVLMFIALNCLLVGFSEELMFRGALLQAFRHATSIWPAVILTSLAFGSIHTLNVFITGDLTGALIQACAAFLSGLVFIALRLRSGTLWLPIIVHALWDFATFTLGASVGHANAHGPLPAEATAPDAATGMAALAPVLIVLPNAIYGLWLMRNIGRTHTDPEA